MPPAAPVRAGRLRSIGRRRCLFVALAAACGLSCAGGPDTGELPGSAQPAPPSAGPATEARVWASAEGCAAALAAGGRLALGPGRVRLATWNLRWFPRGCPPDRECPAQPADVDWLACGIAWMQVDVLAVQEVLASEAGARGLAALTRALDARTGGRWLSDVQACGEQGAQAVGFVWNAARVELREQADLWELNGDRRARAGDACAARLRPGRHARLLGAGGLDVSLVAVHLDSGRRALDWERRRRALARLPDVRLMGRRMLDLEEDVVALGDFNSMGRDDAPEISQQQEIAELEAELGGAFRLARPAAACTGYYPSEPGLHARTLLDHLIPSLAMTEAATAAQVSGFCAALGCPESIRGSMPAAFERLSDHCPVLLDLEDRGIDAS
jgi:endonuclease/exonuclease/phosphatase family metal-dependent hydrolase